MRTTLNFTTTSAEATKKQLLVWAQQFDEVVWLDSNNYNQLYGTYDAVLAVEAFTVLQTDYVDAFEKLNEYQQQTKDWIFGYLTYDLKNDTENLISQNYDGLGFYDLLFFQPKKIITLKGKELTFHYLNMVNDEMENDFQEILEVDTKFDKPKEREKVKIKVRLTKAEYNERVLKMKNHIAKGDIYEANFCQEFYAEGTEIDPVITYDALNTISKAPFASYFKYFEDYVLCASPERYIKKKGENLISQPIKGTAKRATIVAEDEQLKKELAANEKERSENVMIVDLVRNDLSKTAQKETVQVEELFKVYTFEQVHQLISTVTSKMHFSHTAVDALKTTFPMGSMTGAPKVSAMQIIENLEVSKRGLYSGAIGYFTPDGDFDFNVVIRSILYNAAKKYVSFSVGSAITAKSNIEAEYEECLLKAKAMRKVLESK